MENLVHGGHAALFTVWANVKVMNLFVILIKSLAEGEKSNTVAVFTSLRPLPCKHFTKHSLWALYQTSHTIYSGLTVCVLSYKAWTSRHSKSADPILITLSVVGAWLWKMTQSHALPCIICHNHIHTYMGFIRKSVWFVWKPPYYSHSPTYKSSFSLTT